MQIRLMFFICLALVLLITPVCHAAELHGPYAKVRNEAILVTATLEMDEEKAQEVTRGVAKEIIFYVDLFRVWERWPDEFVLGKKITRSIHCDPVKNENKVVTTIDNRAFLKRFSSCMETMDWAFTFRDVELSTTGGLEEAEYYIKVTVESRIRELPPFINLLLFFVTETEFKLEDESPSFPLRHPG